jgi:hypothetical protein
MTPPADALMPEPLSEIEHDIEVGGLQAAEDCGRL